MLGSAFGLIREAVFDRRADTQREACLEFGLDALESREMLAGVVQIQYQANGNLTITGDEHNNTVALIASPNGPLSITGTNTQFQFNGVTSSSHTIIPAIGPATLNRIRVNLQDGSDALFMTNFDTGAVDGYRLLANLGQGDDEFRIQQSTFQGDIRVLAGDGDDVLGAVGTTITGNVWFDSGNGGTGITPEDMVISNTIVTGNVTMRGRQGVDWARALQAQVNGRTIMSTGADDDLVVLSSSQLTQRFLARMGSGDDRLDTTSLTALDDFRVMAGAGNDRVYTMGTLNHFFEDFFYAGGGGADELNGTWPTIDGSLRTASVEAENWT